MVVGLSERGATQQPAPLDPCDAGSFAAPFNHKNDNPTTVNGQFVYRWSSLDWQNMGQRFHALHMALISFGPFRGWIVAWSYNVPSGTLIPSGYIFWSLIDPTRSATDPAREMNFKRFFDPTAGRANDIACSGHTWLPDGRLFVVGGTERYQDQTTHVLGAKLSYLFNPNTPPLLNYPQFPPGHEMWVSAGVMQRKRWYPTGTVGEEFAIANPWVAALGGQIDDTQNPVVQDNYELWRPSGGWNNVNYNGPSVSGAGSHLWAYPRTHFLSDLSIFVAGMFYGPRSGLLPLPLPTCLECGRRKGSRRCTVSTGRR